MRLVQIFIVIFLGMLLLGCAGSSVPNTKLRALTYEEASAFERSQQSVEIPKLQQVAPKLFTQPLNKKEPCKLPTSQQQLSRSNFRSYWDGQCKNGHAYGLGRDIAISDTHHFEEISSYDEQGSNFNSPRVFYDYVNNFVTTISPGDKFPAVAIFRETMQLNGENFSVSFFYGVTDQFGNHFITEYSPFSHVRTFINDRQNVAYRFVDYSSMPVVEPTSVMGTFEVLDPKTKKVGGVAMVRYGSGMVRHVNLSNSSQEDVSLPRVYVDNVSNIFNEIQSNLNNALSSIEIARQKEREYLYMACNGKHVISGLDKQTSTKICTWRSQFQVPYEKTLAKYTQYVEEMKRKSALQNQQRMAQQQLNLEQQRLQQQQSNQEIQDLTNAMGQLGYQMQNSGSQILNGVMSRPNPPVNFAPVMPPGGNQIRCVNVGSVTNCRY